ncbi:uncharacterized protein [Narcine bancroftii]|uniref:uncharacterized protein isoform X2 n=1 Tax=Narcine bancroftii TaxID=1343680 RepID=UPI0038320DA0
MSPFGQEMMYFNTSPSIHPITGCVGDLNQGADPGDEPQVHRIQVPTDQSTSVGQSLAGAKKSGAITWMSDSPLLIAEWTAEMDSWKHMETSHLT